MSTKFYLLRPTPAFSNPPLCSLDDLRTKYSLDDLADFHEALDIRDAVEQKAAEEAERNVRRT